MNIFHHINIRSNILLPEKVRFILDDLTPVGICENTHHTKKTTYIQLDNIDNTTIQRNTYSDGSFYALNFQNVTIEEYFKKWEHLLREIKKTLY